MVTIEQFVDNKRPQHVAVVGPNEYLFYDPWAMILSLKPYVKKVTIVDAPPKRTPECHGNIHTYTAQLQKLCDANIMEMPRVTIADATKRFAVERFDMIIDYNTARYIFWAKEERENISQTSTATKLVCAYTTALKKGGCALFFHAQRFATEYSLISAAASVQHKRAKLHIGLRGIIQNPLVSNHLAEELKWELGIPERNLCNDKTMRALQIYK